MRIKIIYFEPFQGMTSGWSNRFIGILDQLYKYHALSIFVPGDTSLLRDKYPLAFVCQSTSTEMISSKFSLFSYILSYIVPDAKNVFLPMFNYYPDFLRITKQSKGEFDLIVYFGLSSYAIYRDKSNIPQLCDFCDSLLRHFKSQKKIHKSFRKRIVAMIDILYLYRVKRRLIPKDLQILVITAQDCNCVKKILKQNRVHVVPNGINVPEWHLDENYQDRKFASNKVLFCGTLNYEPNICTIEFIITKLWASIREKYSNLVFQIVGRDPCNELYEIVRKSSGIEIHANVQDVFKYYGDAKFVISPMFMGGGLKNKILESLITGTPVISNREGVIGIGFQNAKHGYLGESQEEMLNNIDLLMRMDQLSYSKIVDNCRKLGEFYNWSSIGGKIEKCLTDSLN